MDLDEEKKLVERACREPEAFSQLFDHYYGQIFGYALKRVANVEIAQDITSDVFFKALRNLKHFRCQNVPFSSWLYRIATNQINDYFREGKRRTLAIEKISGATKASNPTIETELLEAEEELKKYEDFLSLHESISRLPIRYQEVITLRFFEKKQVKEIAQILGKPEGTVKALLHRGLEKLREMIE